MTSLKRQIGLNSDINNIEVTKSKKLKSTISNSDEKLFTVGQIKELHMLNFMCHKNFHMTFYPTHMQIITGANGSGKSTIANAICLCLGAQAKTTGRTSNVQSFIRKGETSSELTIILANEGQEAYKSELYGKEIQIIRKIGPRQSSYKILSDNGRVISTRKETVEEIIQALSISPENPLCVLHQEIAKKFLINSDSRKKYQFYMKVSQLDQIKQAYEQSICTIQFLTQRVNGMKQKHINMIRELKPLEQEVKKIELRRDYQERKYQLEDELKLARTDEIQQELYEIQDELEEIQRNKKNIDEEILQENDELVELDRRLNNHLIEKNDLEKDTNGLKELLKHFSKQRHDTRSRIQSLTQDCEDLRKISTDIELKQIYLQQQIDKYENRRLHSENDGQQRSELHQEISDRREKQFEWDKIMISLTDEFYSNEEDIRDKQLTIHFLANELKQKQENLDELIKIDQDKINVYGLWMSDCLKDIQNNQQFQQKPIGPIGRYIHCIDSHWIYAVEKHLAPIMSSFICANNDDERLLLEILSSYSFDQRPPIYIRAYSDKVYDISGTLNYIKQANLLPMYDVLKIDDPTVECTLIDLKQIEATILLENLQEVKQVRESGVLDWRKIDRKVKQVTEAWTCDGSNIKLNKTLRIYTNEKQTMKYFLSNSKQTLFTEELQIDIKCLHEQIQQMNETMNNLTITRQTTTDKINQTKKTSSDNQTKLKELTEKFEYLSSTMFVTDDYSLDELQEKARYYLETYNDTISKYEEAKEKKEENIERLTDIDENYENISKKFDSKTNQYDLLIDKINTKQSDRYQIQRKLKKLIKKSNQFIEDTVKYETKLKQLTRKQSKKSKKTLVIPRSIHVIQQELDAINNYLQANEDTNEQRRDVINTYRMKRDTAKEYKQTYERCYQQIEHLKQFVNKRQEGFLTIADRHQYFLRNKFQRLMEKYDFDDSNITIDHKKEELEIKVKKYQRNLSSLSGGERSISTFCFLLALWESIYQPFRLLDEIDIYMDNEKFSSSLDILYDNTLNYSCSQHIIFTPQTIDVQLWNDSNVPVFNIPTPKRFS